MLPRWTATVWCRLVGAGPPALTRLFLPAWYRPGGGASLSDPAVALGGRDLQAVAGVMVPQRVADRPTSLTPLIMRRQHREPAVFHPPPIAGVSAAWVPGESRLAGLPSVTRADRQSVGT